MKWEIGRELHSLDAKSQPFICITQRGIASVKVIFILQFWWTTRVCTRSQGRSLSTAFWPRGDELELTEEEFGQVPSQKVKGHYRSL